MNYIPRKFPPVYNRTKSLGLAANGLPVGAVELGLLEQAVYWQLGQAMPISPARLLADPILTTVSTYLHPLAVPQLCKSVAVIVTTRMAEGAESSRVAGLTVTVSDGTTTLTKGGDGSAIQGLDYMPWEFVLDLSDGVTIETPGVRYLTITTLADTADVAVLMSIAAFCLPLAQPFGPGVV
jgi:hypothetical protein